MAAGDKRGFASMNQDRQKEIASMGGRAAHERGTAHEFTADEARAAGRKGGEAVSRDRAHMAAIGRKGGEARSESRGRGSRRGSSENGQAAGRKGLHMQSDRGDGQMDAQRRTNGHNGNGTSNSNGNGYNGQTGGQAHTNGSREATESSRFGGSR